MNRLFSPLIFACCLCLVGSAARADINSASISPAVIAPNGTINVSANITLPSGSYAVWAQPFINGVESSGSNSLSSTDGIHYTGLCYPGPNTTGAPQTITIKIVVQGSGPGFAATASGSCIQLNDNQAPVITNVTASAPNLTAAGGNLTIGATIADPGVNATGIDNSTVVASVYRNGVSLGTAPLTASGNAYSGVYAISPNASSASDTITVDVSASDRVRNFAHATGGSVIQPFDNAPPVITNAAASPASLHATGGAITFSATVTDAGGMNTGVSGVDAVILVNGVLGSYQPVTLTRTSGDTYSGAWTAPPNTGASPITYTVEIGAADNAGNSAFVTPNFACVEQNDDYPPVITNIQVSPASVSGIGGPITVTAMVSDGYNGTGIKSVSALAIRNGNNGYNVPPTTLTSVGNHVYTGVLYLPPCTDNIAPLWMIQVSAYDNALNQGTAVFQSDTLQTTDHQAPVITNASASPGVLSAAGGPVEFTANVTDSGGANTGIASVDLSLYSTVALYQQKMPLQDLGGGLYGTTITVPSSGGHLPNWTASLTATDNAGNQVATGIPFSQQGTASETVTNATLTPAALPVAGGQITVSADLSSNAFAPLAVILRNGAFYTWNSLFFNGTSYVGTFNLPANPNSSPAVYTAVIDVEDFGPGIASAVASGACQEASDTKPPLIANALISPATMPFYGSPITVTASVSDGESGLNSVDAVFLNDGVPFADYSMTDSGGGNYAVTYPYGGFPGNTSASPYTITALIVAKDNAGNYSRLMTANSSIQANDNVPPVISSAAITPATIPAQGSVITISATATDTGSGIVNSALHADLYQNGVYFQSFQMPKTQGNVYVGTLNLATSFPAATNTSNGDYTYTAIVTASDGAGNQATLPAAGACVQTYDNQSPYIESATFTPSSLPATGGTVTVNATVYDTGGHNTGIKSVDISFPDAPFNTVYGSSQVTHLGGAYYTATFQFKPHSLPALPTGIAAQVTVKDLAGNTSTMLTNPCQMPNDAQPPVITAANITPSQLFPRGGIITVTANIAETGASNTGALYADLVLYRNGVALPLIPMTNTSGTIFAATYATGANSDADVAIWTAEIGAGDLAATTRRSSRTAGASNRVLRHSRFRR